VCAANKYPCENAGLCGARERALFFISLWIYTMNRCSVWHAAGAAAVLCVLGAGASAQVPAPSLSGARAVPSTATAATLRVEQPPLITLDGQAERLSPGARIYSPARTLVLSASLIGLALPVRYVRDMQGQVHEIWLLQDPHAAAPR